jgi:hypothetical protein
MLFDWFTRCNKRASRPARAVKPAHPVHLRLVGLEDRCVPSIDMVANLSGSATVSGSLPYWVANAANGDAIQFAANLKGGTITLGDTLDITKSLGIDGTGSDITVNGGGNRVFIIEQGADVGINALTITGGVAPAVFQGGGILNRGSLELTNSTVTGNSGDGSGGIYNANTGLLVMGGDTVNNNTATNTGGGIGNVGQLTIYDCTIAANTARIGGGIANYGALKIGNSTVAFNTVTGAGADGGGIYNVAASNQLALLNTIVYNPNSGAATENDVLNPIDQAQGDLFGSGTSGIASGGDLGGNQFNANPLLGALQDNGGPTATMALLPGSPAIGAGAATSQIPGLPVLATDQRGDPRPANSIDIGAFQVQTVQSVPTTTVLASSLNPAPFGQSVTFTATVHAVGQASGTPTGTVTFLDGTTSISTGSLSNGVASLTISTLGLGNHSITATYNGTTQGGTTFSPSTSAALVETVRFSYFAVAGAPGRVQVRRDSDGSLLADFQPFGAAYTGGVSVAVADVNGDGYKDLVVAATAGNPDVRVYDGKALATGTFNPANPNASLLAEFLAYGLNFNVGANVAAGDIEHDGYADIVTGATAGNPDVRVYRGQDIAQGKFDPSGKSLVAQWFPYALNFNVGANVAVGDVTGDGYADVVTGATAGNPDVRVYNGQDIAHGTFNPTGKSLLAQFFAYGLNFNVGAFVAVGDTTGSSYGDIITGASAGNPDVHVYSGQAIANHTFDSSHADTSLRDQFFAYGLNFNVGATVASADFEGTGKFDILTGASAGAPDYRVVKGTATGTQPPALFEGLPSDLQGGIAVGA